MALCTITVCMSLMSLPFAFAFAAVFVMGRIQPWRWGWPKKVLQFVFSPTRQLFELLDKKKKVGIQEWAIFWLFFDAALLGILPCLKDFWSFQHGLFIVLWLFPFSRIIEVVFAHYHHAIDSFNKRSRPRHNLKPAHRLLLLGMSYVEIAICYASLYFAIPSCYFQIGKCVRHLDSSVEALYFSWITITTTGYGDITPTGDWTRLLCGSEIGFGLIFVVFAVGSYLANANRDKTGNRGTKSWVVPFKRRLRSR